ncbi:MAG: YndJ family transporter [Myxococcaceae bacterium]|nr:YndJ family transporter [Myxococcaceae bacterium]
MTPAEAMVPVMNVALVLGVAVVMPLAFQRRFTPWQVAALAVAASLAVAPGWPAGAVLGPWLFLCLVEVVGALRRKRVANVVMAGFGVTAALALVASRLEVTLFEIPEPIVKLTAVHFSYAGVGALSLAQRLVQERPTRARQLVGGLLMLAPPIVALGFITRLALFQVGGAALMAVGVCGVAVFAALEANRRAAWPHRLLLLTAASPWVAMALALAWAANQYWPAIPALTVVDMVPTHGALNAFGFILPGHLAFWLDDRSSAGRTPS